MKKKVVFLFGNSPMSLPVNMMRLLRREGGHRVKLLYYDRGNSPIKFPLPGLLDQKQCSAITWPVGNYLITKIINRVVVLGLFVKKIREFNPDVIHAWNLDMLLAARIAAIGLKRPKIVFSLQDTTELMLTPIFKAIQRWAYRGTDLIFVTSPNFETHFLRKFKLVTDDKKIVFVPNVPPAQHFSHFEPRKPGPVLTAGYVGTFRGKEGILTLVKATELARERGANVRVLFAGTGIERKLVERLAKRFVFVNYLGPYRYDQEILDIYSQVDVLYALYNQNYDKKIHLAYRLCEAVNCSLPIIVAKGTHMSEVVESHKIGVSVELGDVEELAQVLVMFFQSPLKRIEFAHNCKKARPNFVFEYYQERICTVYGDL